MTEVQSCTQVKENVLCLFLVFKYAFHSEEKIDTAH